MVVQPMTALVACRPNAIRPVIVIFDHFTFPHVELCKKSPALGWVRYM